MVRFLAIAWKLFYQSSPLYPFKMKNAICDLYAQNTIYIILIVTYSKKSYLRIIMLPTTPTTTYLITKTKIFSKTYLLYHFFILFYNILSDCHYSDVMNSLLNAFRLKKIYILYFILFSGQIRWQVGSGNLCFEKWNRFPPIFCGHSGFQYSGDKTRGKYFLNQQILEMRREFVGPQTLFAWDLHS